MLQCIVEGRNLVNGNETEYNISDGATFTENGNETLDSGTIIIPQLTSKIEVEPYDVVVINDTNGIISEKRMCVDTVICTQISLDPSIYQYTITLFSETKLLEGILLPSLAITKVKGTTRTIAQYINEYIIEYGTKTGVSGYNANGIIWTSKFTVDSAINTKFSDECPEMQWNEPTLREVLNDLMMVKDCIPIVRNNVITYMDISTAGSEISTAQRGKINYITESQSSEDYVSDLKVNIQNALNTDTETGDITSYDDADIPKCASSVVEYIGFRNFDVYQMTTERLHLETQMPIWKLYFCEVNIYLQATGRYYDDDDIMHTVYFLENIVFDLTPYILEHGVWQTKNIDYSGFDTSSQSLNTTYQNTCLYYQRGQKGIFNFDAKLDWNYLFISSQVTVYELMAKAVLNYATDYFLNKLKEDYPVSQGYYNHEVFNVRPENGWQGGSPTLARYRFRIKYESIDNVVYVASKMVRNKRKVVDHQNNSYIDTKRFGFLEELKAKRLGNKMKLINGRYGNENEMPTIFQTLNGSIIFNKEMSVYHDHISVNYRATDNYVLRDYYTGVKSKLRSWRIVSGSEAFIRAENIKFYTNSNINGVRNENVKIPAFDTLNEYLEKFNYCVLQFRVQGGTLRPFNPDYNYTYNGNPITVTFPQNALMQEFSKRIVGNSVLFTFRMFDNTIAGKYIYGNYSGGNPLDFNTLIGMQQKNIQYTDNNGEFIEMIIYFFNQAEHIELGGNIDRAFPPSIKPYTEIAPDGNFVEDDAIFKLPIRLHKDNKEIPQITIQFELNTEANSLYFGKE